MNDRSKLVMAAGLVLGASLAGYLYYRWEAAHRAQDDMPTLAALELEPQKPEPDRKRSVDLFLFSPEKGKPGNSPLEKVSREVALTDDNTQLAQQIVNAVIRESGEVLPPTARVLQAYILPDGTAVVDLSREVAEQLNGGAGSELAILNSFTRSIRENVPSVQRVRFLVEGEPRPTLSGHVSIRNPFM